MQSQRPQSKTDLFLSFSILALQGFGGVLAVVQRELVEKKKWLTREEFLEDWAVAQILPGPNVVNLSLMIGDRYFGLRGALTALAGMLTFPLLIVLALAVVFGGIADTPMAEGALRGMGAVAAG
jgi:chromate transporter